MNPAIAALIKMLGIDPQQLEQMVNGSQQILADFDNRLKLTLAGIEELKEGEKRATAERAQILALLEVIKDGRLILEPNSRANGSASGYDSLANQPRPDDITPGRSGGC